MKDSTKADLMTMLMFCRKNWTPKQHPHLRATMQFVIQTVHFKNEKRYLSIIRPVLSKSELSIPLPKSYSKKQTNKKNRLSMVSKYEDNMLRNTTHHFTTNITPVFISSFGNKYIITGQNTINWANSDVYHWSQFLQTVNCKQKCSLESLKKK